MSHSHPAPATRPARPVAIAVRKPPAPGDHRFRTLIGALGWDRLPTEVRERFSRKAGPGQSIVYAGRVTDTHMTPPGRILAWLCLLIGGPLPTSRHAGGASVVAVTEDLDGGGQTWTRLYAQRGGFPQVIHSAKRFAGPTGLEEHVGRGIGMTLHVLAEPGALVFRSDRYFIDLAGWRVYIPGWLTPGALTVRHTPVSPERFIFSLDIDHPHFGRILSQSAIFEEAEP